MNQEFIYEMQQILNGLDGQIPSMIVEKFITTIGNKESAILHGAIATEDFAYLIPLVNENLNLEQRQKELLVESLNISIKNAKIAAQLRQVMTDGSVISSLRPILILNIHNDPAMYMLLTNSITELVQKGYHIILNEDVSEEHLSEEEWNKECDRYLQNLSEKEQKYLKLSSLNTHQILELFRSATEDFQKSIDQDFITDLKDKEQADQFDKELSAFTLKCNAMIYKRRYHAALSNFRLANPRQEIITEDFDARSKAFNNEQETNLLLHLSNIGFALQIALKSYVNGSPLLIVGLAHGQGICDIYGKLFPQLLQPLSIIPCHYTFTKETPTFISDSFRHKQYIINDFLQTVQNMEYAIIDMALYVHDAAKHFSQIIDEQKIDESNRLKLFSRTVITEELSTVTSSSVLSTTTSNSAMTSGGGSLLIPANQQFDINNIDVDTIDISYAYKAKRIKYISLGEFLANNLRSKYALLLDYQRMLKRICSDINKMGGGVISIIHATAKCHIAGDTYTFDLKEAITTRLQSESSQITAAHIEEITEEGADVEATSPVEFKAELITPAFQLTTMQGGSSRSESTNPAISDDDVPSQDKCKCFL